MYEKYDEGFVYYVDKKQRRRLIVRKDNREAVIRAHLDTPFGWYLDSGEDNVYNCREILLEEYGQ